MEIDKPAVHVVCTVCNWVGIHTVVSVTFIFKIVSLQNSEACWTVRVPLFEGWDIFLAEVSRCDSSNRAVCNSGSEDALLSGTCRRNTYAFIPIIVEGVIANKTADAAAS